MSWALHGDPVALVVNKMGHVVERVPQSKYVGFILEHVRRMGSID